MLIERGYRIGGMILTGAACEADIHRSQIFQWYCHLQLGAAIAYSSEDDHVVDGDARAPMRFMAKVRAWLWGKLMRPYGCLGRTGWLSNGKPLPQKNSGGPTLWGIFTRWYPGGHSAYFHPERIHQTFEQIYQDIRDAESGTPDPTRCLGSKQLPGRNANASKLNASLPRLHAPS
jgi:hypothetical protein